MVLVADDDPGLVRAISERLRSAGMEVITCQDAYQAVEQARRRRPDVLVVDIHMPAGDGLSVLDRVSRMDEMAGVPVLVITGDPDPGIEETARRHGAAGLIRKPFETRWLVEQVQRAAAAERG